MPSEAVYMEGAAMLPPSERGCQPTLRQKSYIQPYTYSTHECINNPNNPPKLPKRHSPKSNSSHNCVDEQAYLPMHPPQSRREVHQETTTERHRSSLLDTYSNMDDNPVYLELSPLNDSSEAAT